MRNGVYMATSPYLRLRELMRDFDAAPGLALLAAAVRAAFAGAFEMDFFTAEVDGLAGVAFFATGAAPARSAT
jgi:hypothetical protein